MKLLYPEFLYALAALVIPIIIHLFNFRKYKLVKFSQVRFLKDIQQQTQSTSKLKHWLVLLSRCLAIAALVLAFCQPFLISEDDTLKKGKKGVSIYLDNSFSMQAKAESGQLLDLAKNKCLAVVSAFKASDRFQLITNDFKAEEQHWVNKEAFVEHLQSVEISPKSRRLSEIIVRQNALFEEDQSGLVPSKFMISDLQKTFFDWEEVLDSAKIQLLPLFAEKQSNLSLDSLAFSKPYRSLERNESIRFWVNNHSEEDRAQIPAKLSLNEELKAPLQLSVKAGDTSISNLSYRNGKAQWQKGVLSIQDFPINFDDSLYFSYPLLNQVKVLHLHQGKASEAIQRLFQNDSLIDYYQENLNQANFSEFSQYQFIVLDEIESLSSGISQELRKFIEAGHSLCIFPSLNLETASLNQLLSSLGLDQIQSLQIEDTKVNQLNVNADLYENVFEELPKNLDLPKANKYWSIEERNRLEKENILRFSNGKAALNKYRVNGGKLYLSALSLSDSASNFIRHAIFVPTLYNMALQSISSNSPLHFLDGSVIHVRNVESSETPVRLVQKQTEFIPKQRYVGNELRLDLGSKLMHDGHYKLMQGEKFVGWISLNYKREESKMEFYLPSEVEELAKQSPIRFQTFDESDEGLTNQIIQSVEGKSLWKYFILLALVFLAIEILLLRLLK
ncbi:MAG: BatA domain-containing protein [Vicingaceae bacterium]